MSREVSSTSSVSIPREAGEPRREEIRLPNPRGKTLVFLEGGHKTLVSGMTPGDLDDLISAARLNETQFLYLQSEDRSSNSVCIDPKAVVALIRTD